MVDSEKVLICPACGEEMNKIYIEDLQCFIDICANGCGGIFFDNREYKKVIEKNKIIDQIRAALEGKTFQKVDPSYKRTCPACGMKMAKNSTSVKGEIIVDDCYGCGGKFLDFGELEKVQNEYESDEERSKDVMEYLKANMGAEFTEMQAYNKVRNENPNRNKSGMMNKFNGIIDKFL